MRGRIHAMASPAAASYTPPVEPGQVREFLRAGGPESWVWDTKALQITVHREPRAAAYASVQLIDKTTLVRCEAVPEIELRLIDLLTA